MDYRAILETVRDAIVVADARGTVVYANPAAAELLGYSSDGLRGRAVATLLPERLRSPEHALYAALLGRGEAADAAPVQTVALTGTGEEIPVDISVDRTSFNGQSSVVWLLRSGRQRAELESRLAVSDALSAMADAFVQMNANPDVDHVTQLAVDTLVGRLGGEAARIWLFDRSRQRLDLHAWAGLPPSLDHADAIGADPAGYGLGLEEVVRTLAPSVMSSVNAADGAVVPEWFRQERLLGYALHPLVFADQLVGVTGYFTREPIPPELFQVIAAFARHVAVALHDVREQAQARRQIEALASEAHARTGEFEAIVSNMPDAVFVARGGRIAFVNRSAARMLGFENPADLQVPLDVFTQLAGVRNPDGTPVTAEDLTMAHVLAGEVVTGREQRMMNARTGRDVWVQISGAPLRDKAGRIQGGVVVATEITRLKELEHSKDEWLAIAAHELRTPLTPITVHLQMAQRRLHMGRPLDPEVFDKALDQVKRLARLVNGLLDVTRLQAGQLDLVLEDVDLREIAENIVERVRHGAPHHTLVLDMDPDPVVVRADRARIDEVLSSLVDNAIKYSPDGGEVWVTVREEHGEARVDVRDEGIGIAPEERAQIFERYFRAGSVPHTQYGGLGLGLWIAGKVVQRHGGHIDLESTPFQGSTFSVSLPLARAAMPAAEERHPPRTRILVVDDDLAVLDAVKGLLDDDGYEVRVARSGTEAISEARAWAPDVMLLDLRMPGMDGWEVRRRFAADPLLAKVPVVLVSADRDARLRAAGMDVQGFVAKPFDLDEIERVLQNLLGRRADAAASHGAPS